jgi:hypothetical protein
MLKNKCLPMIAVTVTTRALCRVVSSKSLLSASGQNSWHPQNGQHHEHPSVQIQEELDEGGEEDNGKEEEVEEREVDSVCSSKPRRSTR